MMSSETLGRRRGLQLLKQSTRHIPPLAEHVCRLVQCVWTQLSLEKKVSAVLLAYLVSPKIKRDSTLEFEAAGGETVLFVHPEHILVECSTRFPLSPVECAEQNQSLALLVHGLLACELFRYALFFEVSCELINAGCDCSMPLWCGVGDVVGLFFGSQVMIPT